MISGTVLNIQRFCTDDGPGIRTTVFLKGCPLHCIWCHNPESQAKRPELSLDMNNCITCGRCSSVCPKGCHVFDEKHTFKADICNSCGECVKVCPKQCLELYGKELDSCAVFSEIQKDRIFYDTSGGGVTISGGEPLFQPNFTVDILKKCRESGIHTAIETCGFTDKDTWLSVIKHCDLVLFDIKETDSTLHRRYTGVSFEPILNNLKLINEKGVPFIIRAPIIPTLNDRESHLEALKALCASMQFCKGIEIMPYHRTGEHKYRSLGKKYICKDIPIPTREMTDSWNEAIQIK